MHIYKTLLDRGKKFFPQLKAKHYKMYETYAPQQIGNNVFIAL